MTPPHYKLLLQHSLTADALSILVIMFTSCGYAAASRRRGVHHRVDIVSAGCNKQ